MIHLLLIWINSMTDCVLSVHTKTGDASVPHIQTCKPVRGHLTSIQLNVTIA